MSTWDHNRTLRGAWNPQLAVKRKEAPTEVGASLSVLVIWR